MGASRAAGVSHVPIWCHLDTALSWLLPSRCPGRAQTSMRTNQQLRRETGQKWRGKPRQCRCTWGPGKLPEGEAVCSGPC